LAISGPQRFKFLTNPGFHLHWEEHSKLLAILLGWVNLGFNLRGPPKFLGFGFNWALKPEAKLKNLGLVLPKIRSRVPGPPFF